MYEIRIWQFQQVMAVYRPQSWAEARELYLRQSERYDQYTQLAVYGIDYTTAQAWRHFELQEGRDDF